MIIIMRSQRRCNAFHVNRNNFDIFKKAVENSNKDEQPDQQSNQQSPELLPGVP